LNLSDRGVLAATFLLALGVGVLALLGRRFWRRLSLQRRYRGEMIAHYGREAEPGAAAEDVRDALQWWLGGEAGNGSNGTAKDAEALSATPRSGADAPTGT
jgi:hypothetical protein